MYNNNDDFFVTADIFFPCIIYIERELKHLKIFDCINNFWGSTRNLRFHGCEIQEFCRLTNLPENLVNCTLEIRNPFPQIQLQSLIFIIIFRALLCITRKDVFA